MSIPLERLYHYVERIAEDTYGDSVIIYRFYPHGSKKLEHLKPLRSSHAWDEEISNPHLVCHDQEPLNFDFYQNQQTPDNPWRKLLREHDCYQRPNLGHFGIFDKQIILHSEQKSKDLVKYQNAGFIPVYYWNHAMLSRDWFRFAEHIQQKKKANKIFLIYNRAWSGTREYRLKFADLLVSNNLVEDCKMTINPVDPDIDQQYSNYQFANPVWKPCVKIEEFFPTTSAQSWYSADFDLADYEHTQIEIVLETLFDDARWHLTEKTLRPIACGQPFLLACSAGILSYLRSYGFKTFDSVWDETYDHVVDPYQRLEQICHTMKEIANWSQSERQSRLKIANDIADYNKKHFFSLDFWNLVTTELHSNLKLALDELVNTNTGERFFSTRKNLSQVEVLKNIITGRQKNPSIDLWPADHPYQDTYMKTDSVMKVLQKARRMRTQQSIVSRDKIYKHNAKNYK
jgi:hypothetical protein